MQGAIGLLDDLLARPLQGQSFGNRVDLTIDLIRAIRTAMSNVTLTTPGLAIGSSSKAKVLTAAFNYTINGTNYQKASVETAFTATTHDITHNAGGARERFYLYSINAAGTITVTAGTQGAVGSGTIPSLPSGECPIGLLRLEVNTSTDFDASTDLLDAGHITDEYTSFVGTAWPLDVSALSAPDAL